MDFEAKNVAAIFKILVGTMVVIVLTSLIIELFNTTMTATFVRGIVTKSIEKSCDFFSQETYIRDEDGTSKETTVYSPVKPIKYKDGTVAVSNDFFGSNNQDTIYYNMYKTSRDFRNFVMEHGHQWLNLRRLGYGLYGATKGNSAWNLKPEDKAAGKTYAETNVTALNSGITYLDKDTLEKIARWNIVANFYGGNPDMLIQGTQRDEASALTHKDDYVLYDGYKIYYNTLDITDINYDVYDVSTTTGARNFAKRTGVGWDSAKNDVDASYWTSVVGLDRNDERKNICVADVNYTINISYDGITPIKPIIHFFISSSNRMNERASEVSGNVQGAAAAIQGYQNVRWSDTVDGKSVTSGEYNADDYQDFIYRKNSGEAMASTQDYSLINFNGKVTYYIVR